MQIVLAIVVGLGIAGTLGALYGASRWRSATRALVSRVEEERVSIHPARYDSRELVGLPVPVQRYFREVLTDGQPLVTGVRVTHAGTFNLVQSGERWTPFTSTQRIVTQRPGFVWDARISMMPGVVVRVHDAFVAGEGILHATLFGLVTLVDMRGTPDMAEGELLRFFAEAAWYPTALLPGQGVRWEAVDATSAQATMRDGGTAVTMLFRFNEAGLIESGRASRGRTVGGAVIPTPWECRYRTYDVREGMRIPLEGEVAWLLPEGRTPYWRGRLTGVTFEFVR